MAGSLRFRLALSARTATTAVLVGSTLGLLCVSVAAESQPAREMRRVGLVASEVSLADVFGPNPRWPHWAALVEELRALGWVERQSIRFERRSDEGQPARRSEIFEELVQLQMDALVTVSNPMAVAARRATRTIPIVMVVMAFPVETGLVASLARPGGNVTGLSTGASRELNAKRLSPGAHEQQWHREHCPRRLCHVQ